MRSLVLLHSHLDEETIKQLFLKAANAIFAEKDGVRGITIP